MYSKLNQQKGVEIVHSYLAQQQLTEVEPDGLSLAPPADGAFATDRVIPERLMAWLTDIRLLRHVPLSYLVPDAELLPTESIRFFHVDPTWVDRIIDGVFAAASTGTVDLVLNCQTLMLSRAALDKRLSDLAGNGWSPAQGMTGMLIRSELVRRWPDMIIRGYAGNVAVPSLRAETISRDVYIVLFAGQPDQVTLQEPPTGLRFGVETDDSGQRYQVRVKDQTGKDKDPVTFARVALRDQRVIDLDNANAPLPGDSRQMALNLQQKPYVHTFTTQVREEEGSVAAPETMVLSNGSRVALGSLQMLARQTLKVKGA